MKNKVISLVLIAFLAMSGALYANNRKANRYFELYRYSKAIPLYKRSLSSRDESIKREAIIRLGDCYRLINDHWEAQSWYSRALLYPDSEPLLYYYLGQSLQKTEQYDEAQSAFQKYAALNPSDPRGKILAEFCEKIKDLSDLPSSAEIKNVASVNTKYSEFSPVFFREGIVFVSDRRSMMIDEITDDWTSNSFMDLYYAEPRYFRNFWMDMNPPEKMPGVFNQKYHDGPISFSWDYKMVFLTRTTKERVDKDKDRVMTNRLQIVYTRMPLDKNSMYAPFPYNNTAWSVAHPAILNNGSKLIFASDMPGGYGGIDLYVSERIDGKWSKPENLGPSVNTFGNEVFPYCLNDTILWFSSDGHAGFGGLDLFESQLKNGKWSEPANLLKPINSSYDDFGIVFNPQKKSGFFSSDRIGGNGADDIYAFRFTERQIPAVKTRPVIPVEKKSPKMVCGQVIDKSSLEPVPNATVFLLNTSLGKVMIAKTDRSGFFQMPIDENTRFIVKAMKSGYFENCHSFLVQTLSTDDCFKLPRNLLIEKYSLDEIFTIQDIYYDLDKWDLRPDALPPLSNIIRLMEDYPINIELSSHTDSRSSGDYNLQLSQKRAESAKKYITAAGINPARIEAKGYGETRLVNPCADGVPCSESEHQANRRTEFKITSIETQYFGKKAFDPSQFREGELLSVEMFDPAFFSECLSDHNFRPSVTPVAFPVTEAVNRDLPVEQAPKSEPATGQTGIPGESFFTIQIAAGKPAKGATGMDTRGEKTFTKEINGYTKYYVGRYTDLKAATTERQRIIKKFPGAFIVAFHQGNVVPVNELKEILKQN